MMTLEQFNEGLTRFLSRSPTPFHACGTLAESLQANGFVELQEKDHWQLEAGKAYYVIRNGGSLVAFRVGQSPVADSGWHMVGAHTDSPCLRVKPEPVLYRQGYFQLGVEVYGGALLNPWFDRDLGLAGRVSYRDEAGQLQSCLLDTQRPVGIIPSLAIHLDRDANTNRTVNPQTDLPVLMACADKKPDFKALLARLLKEGGVNDVATVLDYELSFYDCQPPEWVGLEREFLASARLDNLLSCYVGMMSIISASPDQHTVLVCNDHEEVGSQSSSGAQGPMLESVLRRVAGDEVSWQRAIAHSTLVSVDNAHGIHPNFSQRHDANHGPRLNKGAVIKINVNQRYATNSDTSALFRHLCEQVGEPVQSFVVRSDMACGSTIGPITSSAIGVATLDVGVPTFAMHSIRELAGHRDAASLCKVLTAFFNR